MKITGMYKGKPIDVTISHNGKGKGVISQVLRDEDLASGKPSTPIEIVHPRISHCEVDAIIRETLFPKPHLADCIPLLIINPPNV